MGPQSITGLSPDEFKVKAQDVKLLLLYPRAPHRNAFLAYIVDNPDRELIYYRASEDFDTLRDLLQAMLDDLGKNLEGFGRALSQALDTGDAVNWGEALAKDLNAYAEQNPIWLFIDEMDRVPHDSVLREFMNTLMEGINRNTQIVVSSRLLKYQPWYNFLDQKEAVVLGTERRMDDIVFTLEEDPRPPLEVYALGRGYALANGQEITQWDGALPRNLFFYFMDNLLVTRDEIFDIFWPKLNVKEATNVFHVTKRKISERITDKIDMKGNFELTKYGSGFYTPSEKLVRHYDVAEFEEAVNKAVTALDDEEEERLLMQAIDLYKGPFLQDGTMDWMIERRNELQNLYAQALIGMGRLRKRQGNEDAALGFFIRALKETPAREDIHREVMTLYLNQDRISDARAQYALLEKILKENLNIKPSRESRDLYEMIVSRA